MTRLFLCFCTKLALTAVTSAVLSGFALNAAAQADSGASARSANWPSKTVTMRVGFPAGSGSDSVARFLAENLRERTGQSFVIENQPGAAGNIAAQSVARAAPDGYTAMFGANGTLVASPHLFKTPGFDPVKDFTPVTAILTQAFVLLVNPAAVPVNSVAELTSYLKAQPGKFAHGAGNPSARVAAELYRSLTGIDVLNVPYKGVPPAMTDLLGGRVHFMFVDAGFGVPQSRSGKVKALAVTTARRISAAPDIPTMAEAGVPGFELSGWLAVFFPANAPKDVTHKFAELCNAIMTSEKGREFLKSFGADPFPGSPESLAKWVESELAKWGRIIKAAGIQPE